MNSFYYLIYTISLFVVAILYFKLARRYKIVDLPNHRTMHKGATIRGGGIIIFLGVAVFSLFVESPGYFFFAGFALLALPVCWMTSLICRVE